MTLLRPLAIYCTFEGSRYRVDIRTFDNADEAYQYIQPMPDNACIDYIDNDTPYLTAEQFSHWLQTQ